MGLKLFRKGGFKMKPVQRKLNLLFVFRTKTRGSNGARFHTEITGKLRHSVFSSCFFVLLCLGGSTFHARTQGSKGAKFFVFFGVFAASRHYQITKLSNHQIVLVFIFQQFHG
jgi:hypothetical protein